MKRLVIMAVLSFIVVTFGVRMAAAQCPGQAVVNNGFETGSFAPGWVIDGTSNSPIVTTANPHSGSYSALLGNIDPDSEPDGDSSFYQQLTVPASGGTLSFWHWDYTTDYLTFDWQDAYITDSSGTILTTIFHQASNAAVWTNTTVDMTPYAGQTVRIKFLVHQDGFFDDTAMYVDNVSLCSQAAPAPALSQLGLMALALLLLMLGFVWLRRGRTARR